MLHIVRNLVTDRGSLKAAGAWLLEGSAVLLIEDAVDAATSGGAAAAKIQAAAADLSRFTHSVLI